MSTPNLHPDDHYDLTPEAAARIRAAVVERARDAYSLNEVKTAHAVGYARGLRSPEDVEHAVREATQPDAPRLYMVSERQLSVIRTIRDRIPVSKIFPALTSLRQLLSDWLRDVERQYP